MTEKEQGFSVVEQPNGSRYFTSDGVELSKSHTKEGWAIIASGLGMQEAQEMVLTPKSVNAGLVHHMNEMHMSPEEIKVFAGYITSINR